MRPIHLARLDNTRPVLVLTRELVWPHMNQITVAPITTTVRGLSTELRLTAVTNPQGLTWTYTLTNKRIVEQKGLLTRTGRIIPLNRVNDVAFEKNLNDRILGCGTLIIHDASEQAGLQLRDIPRIEAFHRTVSNLVFDQHDKTASDESL